MELVGGFHPVFLLVVWLHAAAGHVEPPTNVILHCHNLLNVLKWGYNQPSTPGLRFRVDIGAVRDMNGYPTEIWVNSTTTTPLQADVSFLSDVNNEYYLTVTAVIGLNESDSAPHDGVTFSYFKGSQTKQKCVVDFPSVNVTAQEDGKVLFRFAHPWLLYRRQQPDSPNPKSRRKKSHDAQESERLPVFDYDVVIISQRERHHRFYCEERVCEEELPVDAAPETHCLKFKGELQKMSVKATRDFCSLQKAPLERNNYAYIGVGISVGMLALSAVAFVLFMVYHKKTRPSSSLPNSMTFTSRLKQWTLGVVHEPIFVPEVGPNSPTPLLSKEEEFTPTVIPSAERDVRLPIGVPTEDVVVVGNDEGSGYMQGRSLDEDEAPCGGEVPSGYEKRQVLVELAPDEQAEGYRG